MVCVQEVWRELSQNKQICSGEEKPWSHLPWAAIGIARDITEKPRRGLVTKLGQNSPILLSSLKTERTLEYRQLFLHRTT